MQTTSDSRSSTRGNTNTSSITAFTTLNESIGGNHGVVKYCYWMDKVMYVLSVLALMGIGFAYMMIAVPSVVNVISHVLCLSLLSITVSVGEW